MATNTTNASSKKSNIAGYTDTLFQSFKVYIEGVQMPFENITVTQGAGTFPSAVITIPPVAGLMDIAKFYHPKVHIFYEDQVDKIKGVSEKDRMKLLFHGNIVGVSYNKSRTEGSGNMSLQFLCQHRNVQIQGLMVDYTDWKGNLPGNDAVLKSFHPSSKDAIMEALSGITNERNPDLVSSKENLAKSKQNSDGSVSTQVVPGYLPDNLLINYTKLQGMPGVMVNYWQQLKRDAYQRGLDKVQDTFQVLYEPLMENGLKFFERLSGHPTIEEQVEAHRVNPCPSISTAAKRPIVLPPSSNSTIQGAFQQAMLISQLENFMQSDGNITNIFTLLSNTFAGMDYSILTLASPAEVAVSDLDRTTRKLVNMPDETTTAVETIVKPNMPFYFSPSCNVIYPKMFTSLDVNYDEGNVPTRVVMVSQDGFQIEDGMTGSRIRAPASIRDAIVNKLPQGTDKVLDNTVGFGYGAVGIFEQGRGVKPEVVTMPTWLSYLSQSLGNNDNNAQKPDQNDPEKAAAQEALELGWDLRYPNSQTMNPWSSASKTLPHRRMLFAAAEYTFAQRFATSKSGTVSGPFNPYVVPGYPMDILESSPQAPSFHAFCSNVTHNISSQGVSTSISFIGAMTYSEMMNYYTPFIYPSLQVYLGMAVNPTLISVDANAKALANDFYFWTLGTQAAFPESIYDFTTGKVKPVDIDPTGAFVEGSPASKPGVKGIGELNKNLTFTGNLELAYRPIESQTKIESRFGYKFIDLSYNNYSPTVIKYKDTFREDLSTRLEIGESQFLDYGNG